MQGKIEPLHAGVQCSVNDWQAVMFSYAMKTEL